MDLISKTKEFVKNDMGGNDASHDWNHILRVRDLAKKIAEVETQNGVDIDMQIVELSALLHDVGDWKYAKKEVNCSEIIRPFLEPHLESEKIDKIIKVVTGVSFKNELGGVLQVFPELAVVQDADRLDAIGAIGIARTFIYGGHKKRPMYNRELDARKRTKITQKEYTSENPEDNSTIAHFYDKLLHLKDMMKTAEGKRLAEKKHEYMVGFLDEFYSELECKI